MNALREVAIAGHTYAVLFDGAHRQLDCDLLDERDRVPDKQRAVKQVRASTTLNILEDVMRGRSPMTMRALMELTGLGIQTVNSDLYRLKNFGRVASREMPGAPIHYGNRVREYWLIGTEATHGH